MILVTVFLVPLLNYLQMIQISSTEVEKSKIHLKICDVEIQQVDCSKYLGIFIDGKLSWQNHIDYIYNKIIKFTSILL